MATSLVVAAMALILAQLASAQTENVLFNFNNSSTGKDGQTPYLYGSLIMDSEGKLYGAADNGGKSHGVVFKLTPKAKGKDPWKITILHGFGYDSKKPSKSDGDLPESAVIMDGQGNV